MSEKEMWFRRDLENNWHCEARDASTGADLLKTLRNPKHPLSEEEFSQLLLREIQGLGMNQKEYETLIGADFESFDAMQADLMTLWNMLYRDRPLNL